jgi:myo-inositol-1(or 4)-monophosphatase
MHIPYSATINVMIRTAKRAARGMMRDFGEVTELQVSRKGTMDFVTQSDIRAEKIIHEDLLKARPKYGFLMEESGEIEGADGEHRWVIDPIDGTTNFIHAIPYFCISIALEKRLRNGDWHPIAAVIHDPLRDETFYAEERQGAFLNDRRIQVSSRKGFGEAMLATHSLKYDSVGFTPSAAYFSAAINNSKCVRIMGATALDLAYIAAGRYDGAWWNYFKRWDVSAGMLLVKEAAGVITQINGAEDLGQTTTLLAGNPKIHASLLKLFKN